MGGDDVKRGDRRRWRKRKQWRCQSNNEGKEVGMKYFLLISCQPINSTFRVLRACSRAFLTPALELLINISRQGWDGEIGGEGGYLWVIAQHILTHPWAVPGAGLLLFLARHPTLWTQWWWRRLAASKPTVETKPHYRADLRFDLWKIKMLILKAYQEWKG